MLETKPSFAFKLVENLIFGDFGKSLQLPWEDNVQWSDVRFLQCFIHKTQCLNYKFQFVNETYILLNAKKCTASEQV